MHVNKNRSGLSDQKRSRKSNTASGQSLSLGIETRKVEGGRGGGAVGGRQKEKWKGRGLAGQRGACKSQMLVKSLAQGGRDKEKTAAEKRGKPK